MKKQLLISVLLMIILILSVSCREQNKTEENSTKTVIIGTINGVEMDEIALNIYDKYSPTWKMNTHYAEVDKAGNFRFEIESYNMAYSIFSSDEDPILANIFLIDGDTVEVVINYEKNKKFQDILFDGKCKSSQQFFIDYWNAFPDDDEFYEHFYYSYDYQKCKKYWNEQKEKQFKFLEDYLKENELPEFVVDEINNKINYEWAYYRTYYLLFHYYWHPNNDPIELDQNDYDYLNEITINNYEARSSRYYREFLGYYALLLENQSREAFDTFPDFDVRYNAFFDKAATNLNGISRDIVIANQIVEAIQNTSSEDELLVIKKLLFRFSKVCEHREYYEYALNLYKFKTSLTEGKPAYNFTLQDLDGKDVSLSDFKGKIVYIDIWGIGCSPCMTEIPFVQKLHKHLEDVKDEIVFLCINTNTGYPEQVKNFVAKWKIIGTNVITTTKTGNKLREEYMYQGIPHYILIDRNGNFINPNMTRPSDENTEKALRKAIENL